MSNKPRWRPLDGDKYKSCWCVPCTGGRNIAGVWAHWKRPDGFTVCGEFHKPEDFPYPITEPKTPPAPLRSMNIGVMSANDKTHIEEK